MSLKKILSFKWVLILVGCSLLVNCTKLKKDEDAVETPDPELVLLKGIPDLAFWVKGSSFEDLADGAAVAEWSDLSGLQRTASQSAGPQQPVLRLQGLNQKPVVHFNGTQGLALDASFLVNTDYTLFVVGARETGAHCNVFLGSTTPSPRSNIFFGWRQDSGGFFPNNFSFSIHSNDVYTTDGSFTTKTFQLWSATFGQASGKTVHRNGAEFVTDPTKTATLIDTSGTMIGYWPLVSEGLEGDIAEIVIYTHALSVAEREIVESYLKNKYALY